MNSFLPSDVVGLLSTIEVIIDLTISSPNSIPSWLSPELSKFFKFFNAALAVSGVTSLALFKPKSLALTLSRRFLQFLPLTLFTCTYQ